MAGPRRTGRVLRNIRQAIPTNTVLGRRSPGDGPCEFIPLDEAQQADLDDVTATPGSILYRGANEWLGLPPGSNGQVLKLASGLPTWATEGGGSGGGYFAGGTMLNPAVGTFNIAIRGSIFTPEVDLIVTHVGAIVDPASGTVTMTGYVCEVDVATASAVIQTVNVTSALAARSTEPETYRFPFATPITLTAGTPYLFALARTDGTGSSPSRGYFNHSFQPNAPVEPSASRLVLGYTAGTTLSVSQSPNSILDNRAVVWVEGTIA